VGDERAGEPDLSMIVLDDRFIADAAHHEPSARERAALTVQADKQVALAKRQDRRSRRRQRWSDRRSGLAHRLFKIGLVLMLLVGLVWAFTGLGDAVPSDPRPNRVRVVYALPADATADPSVVPAIQHDIDVTQRWLAAQTGGRSLRFIQQGGATEVDIDHLTVTTAELRSRADAAGLVNDEFRTGTGQQPNELLLIFVPVHFSDLVRCGEGSQAGFAIVWMGSCGATPSSATTTFGPDTTFVMAHELIHALGAVQPCAPHYGSYGHVTDNPHDLLYDGPDPRSPDIQLDPGHDDYYATGHPACDIATHPAWQHA